MFEIKHPFLFDAPKQENDFLATFVCYLLAGRTCLDRFAKEWPDIVKFLHKRRNFSNSK